MIRVNLEQAIHEHWADCAALESLLPAERLTTGRTRSGTPPYATIEPRVIRSQFPTNEGPAASETNFRIHVWHIAYDEARAIAEQIRAAFDGATLELAGSDQLARLRHATDSIRQHADGVWQWTIDFAARVSSLP
jgi:hypothetical protein